MQALLPLSLTVANKSIPSSWGWISKPRGWLPPNKNTTVSALQRSAALLSNSSSSPAAKAQEAASLARGLALHQAETKALLLGKSSVLTLVDQPSASSSAAGGGGDLYCIVDRETGQLVGLQQGGAAACSSPSAATTAVVVPTSSSSSSSSSSLVSQVKLAYSFDGLFVSRLVFYLRPEANASTSSAASAASSAVPYTCGSAGGKAVDLLPNGRDFAVTRLRVGCAPLAAAEDASGRRRRRLQRRRTRWATTTTTTTMMGLSAGSFGVDAAPLAAVLASPRSGLGQILAPEEPSPSPLTPTPTTPPTPSPPPPPTPPPEPVMVTPNTTALLAFNATTLTISGSGFDAANPQANVVSLNRGLSPGAVVVAATATTLVLSLATGTSPPTSSGPLTAVVTVTSRGGASGVSSGAPVQVGSVLLPLLNWRGAAVSGDGSSLFLAVNNNGKIWRSLDGGVSFAPTTAPIRDWQVRFFFCFAFCFFILLFSFLLFFSFLFFFCFSSPLTAHAYAPS